MPGKEEEAFDTGGRSRGTVLRASDGPRSRPIAPSAVPQGVSVSLWTELRYHGVNVGRQLFVVNLAGDGLCHVGSSHHSHFSLDPVYSSGPKPLLRFQGILKDGSSSDPDTARRC